MDRIGLRLTNSGVVKRRLLDLNDLEPSWATDSREINMHLAPIATGAKLQKDRSVWDEVSRYLRKTLGLEMEAAAVGAAAHELNIPCVVAKTVVDHTDGNKGDNFHQHGCDLSAAFLFDFFLRYGDSSGLFND